MTREVVRFSTTRFMQSCQLQREDEILMILIAQVRVHPVLSRSLWDGVAIIFLLFLLSICPPLDLVLGDT